MLIKAIFWGVEGHVLAKIGEKKTSKLQHADLSSEKKKKRDLGIYGAFVTNSEFRNRIPGKANLRREKNGRESRLGRKLRSRPHTIKAFTK